MLIHTYRYKYLLKIWADHRYVFPCITVLTDVNSDKRGAELETFVHSRKDEKLIDPYGRHVNSLRLSLTQRCNFNCFFCHKEGESNPRGEITVDEVEAIAAVAAELGVRRFKLTGGEPLLRKDVVELVQRIASYADEVSMTTNGSLLEKRALDLRSAGLRRVNVSLHSRRADVFKRITECDILSNVEGGIRAAVDAGLEPVKINMVVLGGLNEGEVPDMLEFSKEMGAILQLIEFQPLERGFDSWGGYYYDLQPLEKMLEARSDSVYERELQRRRQYHLEGGGIVEVVRPMHNSNFCRSCTRLRVTSDGRLKPCLMRNDNLVEASSLLRHEATRTDLVDAFREAVAKRQPYWREKLGG